ncbi:MAG: hypothetical protein Q4B36_03735 [Tissierellia bacterium]|nr:hypothetical protein [Tissierellia bacterium]
MRKLLHILLMALLVVVGFFVIKYLAIFIWHVIKFIATLLLGILGITFAGVGIVIFVILAIALGGLFLLGIGFVISLIIDLFR